MIELGRGTFEQTVDSDDYVDIPGYDLIPYCYDYDKVFDLILAATDELTLSMERFNNAVNSVIEWCPNRRVAYLALHAKKKRTRKKNLNRAICILERSK